MSNGWGIDFCAGKNSLLASSISEEGSGEIFCGNLYKIPNSKNRFGLGIQHLSLENKGSDFYLPSQQTETLLNIQRGEKGEYITSSKSLLVSLNTIGNETSWQSPLLRLSPSVGIAFGASFGNSVFIPDNETDAKALPHFSIHAGFDVRLFMGEDSTAAPPQELTGYDTAFYFFKMANQLATGYYQAQALSGPAAIVQDYTDLLSNNQEEPPSARMEGSPSLFALTSTLGAMEMGGELALHLKAASDQKPLMTGTLVGATLGAFLLSGNDESATLTTLGTAEGLNLLHLMIARGLDLPKNQGTAKDLLGWRFLTSALVFLIGSAKKEGKMGQAALQGGQQAMMATAGTPDPAETRMIDRTAYHFLYEPNDSLGNSFGFEIQKHLADSNLFTGVKILMQSSPAGPSSLQESADTLTGRDPLTEGAKAKTVALIGLETDSAPFIAAGALRGLILYGSTGAPQPGIGVEGELKVSSGGKGTRFEAGVSVAQDYVNGNFSGSITPFAGLSF